MNNEIQITLDQLSDEIISISGYFTSQAEMTVSNVLAIVNGLEIKHGRACRALDYPLALRLGNALDKLYLAAANDPPPFFPNSRRGCRDVRVRMIRAFGSDSNHPIQDPAELLSLCLDGVPLTLQEALSHSQSANRTIEQIRDLGNIKERVVQLKKVYDNLPEDFRARVDPWLQLFDFK